MRRNSPAFNIRGSNSERTLQEMIDLSKSLVTDLTKLWDSGTIRDVLKFCYEKSLIRLTDRLVEHLTREPRTEEYNAEVYQEEKGDWLCDHFFKMDTSELKAYCDFIQENTAYSTQHGVAYSG